MKYNTKYLFYNIVVSILFVTSLSAFQDTDAAGENLASSARRGEFKLDDQLQQIITEVKRKEIEGEPNYWDPNLGRLPAISSDPELIGAIRSEIQSKIHDPQKASDFFEKLESSSLSPQEQVIVLLLTFNYLGVA